MFINLYWGYLPHSGSSDILELFYVICALQRPPIASKKTFNWWRKNYARWCKLKLGMSSLSGFKTMLEPALSDQGLCWDQKCRNSLSKNKGHLYLRKVGTQVKRNRTASCSDGKRQTWMYEQMTDQTKFHGRDTRALCMILISSTQTKLHSYRAHLKKDLLPKGQVLPGEKRSSGSTYALNVRQERQGKNAPSWKHQTLTLFPKIKVQAARYTYRGAP